MQPDIQWFSTLGVGGAIAGFMFILYRKDVNRYTELWEKQSEQNRVVLEKVADAMMSITIALTKLQSSFELDSRRGDMK